MGRFAWVAWAVVSAAALGLFAPNALYAQPPDANGSQERDTEEGDSTAFDAGGLLGYARLDALNYLAPTLSADVRLSFLQTALRVPIRFRADEGSIRKQDWDEPGDFLRVGQCVRMDASAAGLFEREHGYCLPWEVPRDDYYFSLRLGPIYDFSLGHGTILRTFSGNVDPDHYQAGATANLQFHQFVVAKFLVDSIVKPSLVGGTIALRPFAYETEETADMYEQQHQVQLQLTAVSDLRAPLTVRTAFGQALTDPDRNLLYTTNPVTVLGGDLQYRYVFGTQVELELRADFNAIAKHGMGTHGQLWGIYNHPDGDYSFRGIGEFRYVQRDYVPNYFDGYYGIQRQQFTLGAETMDRLDPGSTLFTTKQEFLNSLDDDEWDGGYLIGLDFEAFRGSDDDRRSAIAARLSLSDNFSRRNDGQFTVTVQVPRLSEKIDIYALFSRQDFDKIADIFRLENTLVKVLARYDLTDQFYLLMNYGRIWQLAVTTEGGSSEGFASNNEFTFSLGFAEGL